MKYFRLTVILLVVGVFVLAPVIGSAQSADDWYSKGKIESNGENHEKAIEYYTKAISINPDYALAYYSRGMCYKALGEKEKANADFKKACDGGIEDACKELKSSKVLSPF